MMKIEYLNDLVKSVVQYLPHYQDYIKKLKNKNYVIVDYARKSPGKEDDTSRISCLQKMINNLKNRSIVDKIFVSANSKSSESIFTRDTKIQQNIMNNFNETGGTVQDLIGFINASEKHICLVILDYFGLSTNAATVEGLIRLVYSPSLFVS
ncbi:unnamed protein product [Cunninghamella blakesleeana]